jgi:hypothetical protein
VKNGVFIMNVSTVQRAVSTYALLCCLLVTIRGLVANWPSNTGIALSGEGLVPVEKLHHWHRHRHPGVGTGNGFGGPSDCLISCSLPGGRGIRGKWLGDGVLFRFFAGLVCIVSFVGEQVNRAHIQRKRTSTWCVYPVSRLYLTTWHKVF